MAMLASADRDAVPAPRSAQRKPPLSPQKAIARRSWTLRRTPAGRCGKCRWRSLALVSARLAMGAGCDPRLAWGGAGPVGPVRLYRRVGRPGFERKAKIQRFLSKSARNPGKLQMKTGETLKRSWIVFVHHLRYRHLRVKMQWSGPQQQGWERRRRSKRHGGRKGCPAWTG